MTEDTEKPKPWERQRNEPSASYALFTEYLLLGPLRTIPKLSKKIQDLPEFPNPPNKGALAKKSTTWKWGPRAEAWDDWQIEEKRSKIESRAMTRLINRLDKSEEIEDKINEEMIRVLELPNDKIKPSKRAYAMKMLSDAKKVELESQRLDLGEPTIIQKTDAKVKTEGEVNVTPAESVKNLEETLNKPIEEKTFQDVINEFETKKQSSELNEGKL